MFKIRDYPNDSIVGNNWKYPGKMRRFSVQWKRSISIDANSHSIIILLIILIVLMQNHGCRS